MDDKALQLQLLGAFEARAGSRVIIDSAWPNRRAATLLKLLAINGGSLLRDQIYEALWPQSEPAAAAGNLRRCLYQLRAALNRHAPQPVLSLEPDRVVLDGDVEVDVDVFLRLAQEACVARTDAARYGQALAAYTGDLLPGDLYEEYCEPLRSDLREQRNRLLLEAALLHESEGRAHEAEEYLRRLIAIDAAHEAAHCALMRVYAASGQRDHALRQYQRCVEGLSRELDAKPSEQAEALYRQIKGTNQPLLATESLQEPAQEAKIIPFPPGLGGPERTPFVSSEGGGKLVGQPAVTMEQGIRFCTTSDGVRIAYTTTGEGPPLVRVLGWFTHLEFEQKMPLWRGFIDGLSPGHLFVRYDGRGQGLSDRDVTDFSPDAKLSDLEAVVDALKLRRFALFGFSSGGPTAIEYAARHLQRVSHLILYGTGHGGYAVSSEDRERWEAMLTLVRLGWGQDNPAFRQLFTNLLQPDGDAEQTRWFNEMQRVSATPEGAVAFLKASGRGSDVRELLPTLVVHRKGDVMVPFERGRDLAALIPGSRFLPLEGNNHLPLPDEPEAAQLLQAINDFMAEGRKPFKRTSPKPAESVGGPLTIFFADITDATAPTQRLGDAKAQELVRAHNSIVREALAAQGGSEIKHTGDGIMASFPTASGALECAVAIQRAVEERGDGNLQVHIGINAGEPVAEDQDLFGTAVQLARRICDHAKGDQILASDVVRQLAAGKGFLFSGVGEVLPKGFDDAVHLYEVRWQE